MNRDMVVVLVLGGCGGSGGGGDTGWANECWLPKQSVGFICLIVMTPSKW